MQAELSPDEFNHPSEKLLDKGAELLESAAAFNLLWRAWKMMADPMFLNRMETRLLEMSKLAGELQQELDLLRD